ncbi:hypothetical protein VTO42DRAFT_6521 [Malbranchea cinnamomea]
MILRRLLLAGTLLLAGLASAKKSGGPSIAATKFANQPINLFYFEDTDTVLFQEHGTGNVHISRNAGETWDLVEGPDSSMKGNVVVLFPHPYDKKKAFALGQAHTHWISEDAGESWRSFDIDRPLARNDPLVFHGKDSNKVLVHAGECMGPICESVSYYTTDGFKTIHPMVEGHISCAWAVSSPQFGEYPGAETDVDDRIFCIVPGPHSPKPSDFRFVYSDVFFKDGDIHEVPLSNGRAVNGVIRTAGVKKFLLAAATSDRTNELALYVTKDAVHWHRAEFGWHRIEEGAYTVLESTNYSVQVSVLTHPDPPMGVLFTSNSNGTYYARNAEHLNLNKHSIVDFEKVTGIQGIMLVNTVKNWEEIERRRETEKKIVSRISFDDGRTFQPLKAGDKELHLHSVTELSNSGRVFSSPAPGLIMGIGNTGKHLKAYDEGDLYVSSDAGLTWRRALKEAHKYEFGDQGSVLLAVYDEGPTKEVSFSTNYGKDWETAELPHKIRAKQLTTTPDSTNLRFLLIGYSKEGDDGAWYLMRVDFSDMDKRKCGKDDFERWPARLNEKGEPDCLMGHKQFYRRRKADADCFIKDTSFKDPVPELERCKCTEEDFECDYNFVRSDDGKSCVPAGKISVPEGQCKNPDDEYLGSSGFRLIPGNDCIRDGGVELDKEIMRPCNDTKAPASGEITVEKTFFNAERYLQYFYLDRTEKSVGEDETIVLLTSKQEVFMTRDHGKTWKQILKDKDIVAMVPHRYFNDAVFFLTAGKKAYYTINRGESFGEFETKLPTPRDWIHALSFHPQHRDWLIWMGAEDCGSGGNCHYTAHYSTDRGGDWHTLMRYVRKCEFLGRVERPNSDQLVLCAQYADENPKSDQIKLISSDDWFAKSTVHFDNILNFATASEFIVVATRDDDEKSLKVDASVDGITYAHAQFPHNFQVEVQQAYTVLPSPTHAIFLHVTVNNLADHEYGSIIKSNSNGTSYVMSINAVNRDRDGYVDFEFMEGLEGVALVNVVSNVKEVDNGAPKKLKTMITHNDGAGWALLPPPKKDADGRDYECSTNNGKPTDKCSLHLHAYTERKDYRDTYSSASAIGLMMGNGNVGEYLTQKGEANTFITRDGGITWHEVKKGNYMWEYGDQGSVIVIVAESKATKTLFYTLDEGESWKEFQFSDVDMIIDDISTVPSDTSLNFLLWGKEVGSGAKSGFVTVNVDFSGLKERERKCVLREDDPEADDYYLWTPSHPMLENGCLFGHVARYHRKKPEAECYNGPESQHLDHVIENCECAREDYECDYNYERQSDGSCGLVPGYQPPDPMQICKDDADAIEYYEPTGYRRIPLTTCTGGLKLDGTKAHPCPNKEKEFEEKHPGISGVGLFFAIVVPIAIAGAVGYYVFTRWDGKFGRIRLGETSSEGWLSRDSPLVSVPVTIVAGTVAVFSALPLLASSLWRSLRGYIRIPGRGGQRPYASRRAFAARRGEYVGVVDDEDELLGADDFEDEDDEV